MAAGNVLFASANVVRTCQGQGKFSLLPPPRTPGSERGKQCAQQALRGVHVSVVVSFPNGKVYPGLFGGIHYHNNAESVAARTSARRGTTPPVAIRVILAPGF